MAQFRNDDTTTFTERYGDGSDGTLTISADTTETPVVNTIAGTSSSGGTSLRVDAVTGFAVNNIIAINQLEDGSNSNYGNWEFNVIAGTNSGTVFTKYPLQNNYYAGGIAYKCKQYQAITVNSGKQWQGATSGAAEGVLIAFCNGTITNAGTINTAQQGFAGGAGVANGQVGYTGGGVLGAGVQQYQKRVNAGGGGNAGNASGGGAGNGGAGTAGANVGGTGGQGGDTVGNAELTNICKGGGGGSGDNHAGAESSGSGGDGGGIIILIAPTINSTGRINAFGGSGWTLDVGNPDNDGGGGAGGSILLKGKDIDIDLGYAYGGAGGLTGGGGAGTGRIHCDYGNTYSISSNPTADVRQDNILNAPIGGGTHLAFEI